MGLFYIEHVSKQQWVLGRVFFSNVYSENVFVRIVNENCEMKKKKHLKTVLMNQKKKIKEDASVDFLLH